MDMRVSLTDYLLPRRVIIPAPVWKGLNLRAKFRLVRRALRMRARVKVHRWVAPGHIYVLDTRTTFASIADLPAAPADHPEDVHRYERMRLYGELAIEQRAKQAASTFRVPFDAS